MEILPDLERILPDLVDLVGFSFLHRLDWGGQFLEKETHHLTCYYQILKVETYSPILDCHSHRIGLSLIQV